MLKARQTASTGKGIRNFHTPSLKFDALDYTEMIDWSTTKILSPPLLRGISDEEIKSFIQSGETPDWDIREVTRKPWSVA